MSRLPAPSPRLTRSLSPTATMSKCGSTVMGIETSLMMAETLHLHWNFGLVNFFYRVDNYLRACK